MKPARARRGTKLFCFVVGVRDWRLPKDTTESRRDEGNNFACQEFVMKAKRSCESQENMAHKSWLKRVMQAMAMAMA